MMPIISNRPPACSKTYILQFAEHADHPHVHFHIIPRMGDMPEENRGIHISNYDSEGAVLMTDQQMSDIARRIQRFLLV